MPKTVRPKSSVKDGKAYLKCPYPDCAYMVENKSFDPNTGLRREMLWSKDSTYGNIQYVHGYVWMRKGKTAWWRHVSKFPSRISQE